jgi:dinuclear metal center YbgI/SA1388 family protein
MSVKCQTVITAMEEFAPKRLAESWDNPGLLIGSSEDEVNKILVVLDATNDVVDYAISNKFDMIVTHHPIIFSAMKSIRGDLPLGKKIINLIRNNICVYSAHTNLDVTNGGINDIFCSIIGVKETVPLSISGEDKGIVYGLGHIGKIDEAVTVREYAESIKEILKLETIRVIGNLNRKVKKVAVCTGAGDSLIKKAKFAGADVYVTGDMKYHDSQDAIEMGLPIIDAGHYATENIAMPYITEYLKSVRSLNGVEIETYKFSADPFTVL